MQSSSQRLSIADIGTGCGCIAVSIATHIFSAHILATDGSSAALEVARRNANKHHTENQIEFIECDILPKSLSDESRFDLICANLPYIPTGKLRNLPIYGREPGLALDGGDDGLDLFRRLLAIAPKRLAPGGRMLLEMEDRADRRHYRWPTTLLKNQKSIFIRDLQQDRLLEIQLPLE